MAKVFLSSTFVEMEEYRRAAFEGLVSYQHTCIRMEDFPASDRDIQEFCQSRVEECDIFVLILGKFYGTPIPQREVSYTEDEFHAAVTLGKPRLIFLPKPGANGARTNTDAALEAMERNGLSYDEQKKRQDKFKQKAVQGVLPCTFEDCDDLKFRVAHSVEELLKVRGPAAKPGHNPGQVCAGEILPLLCDRSAQLTQFGEAFQSGEPGKPEIYVVHGHEFEQHKNCVRRLMCYHVNYPIKNNNVAMIFPPEDRARVEWPDDDAEEILLNRLRRALFQAILPAYSFPQGYAAEAWCKLAREVNASHLRFRHVIRVEDWTGEARRLCGRYLNYWSQIGQWFVSRPVSEPSPRILVFFEFLHRFPATEDTEYKEFRDSLDRVFQQDLPHNVICRVLRELPRVRLKDIDEWYDRYHRFVLPKYQNRNTAELLSELFPETPLPMSKVELRLRSLLGLETHG